MPWLNWSLKLHIRLRTISFLIFTYNTHVYVQWMSYSFMWLYLIKCVFTCLIFVDKSQFFFECFSCFWKVLCFYKNSKTTLPCSGDSVTSRTSHMPQSRVHHRDFSWLTGDSLAGKCFSRDKDLEYFSKIWNFMLFRGSGWWLVHGWKVQSRGVHRDFRGSVHDYLASGTSSREKHLENFFKSFLSSVLVAGPGDLHATWLSRENRVFCTKWVSF